jgi:hypothetical protein
MTIKLSPLFCKSIHFLTAPMNRSDLVGVELFCLKFT